MPKRLDRAGMFIAYCQGVETGRPITVQSIDPITHKMAKMTVPKWKKASYRDLARKYGCTLRAVEKIGSECQFYRRRKYMQLDLMGLLPSNLKHVFQGRNW